MSGTRPTDGGRRLRAALYFLTVVVLALSTSPLLAQSLRVRTYTEGEGLPSSAVRDVTQDRNGLMWFATRAGIASYDGTEWHAYRQREGLTELDQIAVRPGIADGLWSVAASEPLRVFRFEKGHWSVLPSPPQTGSSEPNCLEVFESGGQSLVAVGTGSGLYVWNGEWRRLDATDGLPGLDVRALEAVDGRLFVGTTDGLAVYADGTVRDLTNSLQGLTSPGIYGLARSPIDESLWLGGTAWLGRLDAEDRFELEATLDEKLVVDYFASGVALDADAYGGVYHGNPAILRYYHPVDGFTLVNSNPYS